MIVLIIVLVGGEVWKVTNRLDEREYAVKKILLDPKDESFNLKILREVQTISRMLHKNIVRYYAAWIEEKSIVIDGTASDTSPRIVHDAVKNTIEGRAGGGYSPRRGGEGRAGDGDGGGGGDGQLKGIAVKTNPTRVKEISLTIHDEYFNSVSNLDLYRDNFREDDDDSSDDSSVSSSRSNSSSGGSSCSSAYNNDDDDDDDDNSSSSESEVNKGGNNNDNDNDDDDDSGEDYVPVVTKSANPSAFNSHGGVSFGEWGEFEDLESSDHTEDPSKSHSPDERKPSGVRNEGAVSSHPLNVSKSSVIIIRKLYIQMEYCKATLRDTIDKGQLWQNQSQITRLFRQMVEGIEYIHKEGVIHRDLKVLQLNILVFDCNVIIMFFYIYSLQIYF